MDTSILAAAILFSAVAISGASLLRPCRQRHVVSVGRRSAGGWDLLGT